MNEGAMSSIEVWRRIRHCGIGMKNSYVFERLVYVNYLYSSFYSRIFYNQSVRGLLYACSFFPLIFSHFVTTSYVLALIFVYDYHPLSVTLQKKYFQPGANHSALQEKTIWSYTTQIASALKAIHFAGLACRILDPSKILITGKNRLRINCCGIFDVINYDGGKSNSHFQVIPD
jgi:serine/threonine protein kinase